MTHVAKGLPVADPPFPFRIPLQHIHAEEAPFFVSALVWLRPSESQLCLTLIPYFPPPARCIVVVHLDRSFADPCCGSIRFGFPRLSRFATGMHVWDYVVSQGATARLRTGICDWLPLVLQVLQELRCMQTEPLSACKQ